MDFQAIQNEVGAQLRFDVSVAANLTLVKRWINRAQQYVCSRHDWSWLQSREIVKTVADKTQDSPASSSVDVSVGGTTVTGTGTDFATTDIGRYIQIEGSDDWFKITARTSTTEITIETGWTGTAAASSADYTIRTFYYSLSSSVDRIVSVRQNRSPRKLGAMSPIMVDRWSPFYTDTSDQPYLYSCWGQDSSNNWVVQFYPWPTVAINMEVFYYKIASDLSGNTDVGPIPTKLRDTMLVDGAIAYGREYLNDSRFTTAWNRFDGEVQEAILKDGQNRGVLNVIESADDGVRENNIIHYPSSYPIVDE